MKSSRPIFFVLLLLLLFPCRLAAKSSRQDSILLERIFSFQRNYTHEVRGFATNVYIKHLYQTHQRNIGLWAIPSTYAIAKGQRTFVSEQYSRLYFHNIEDFDHLRQVYYTTIPHNRRTLPVLFEFITPNLYDVTMYGDHILSPFCRENRLYYRYSTAYLGHGKKRLYFRPRIVPNTQLVKGKAIVNLSTGQIEQVELEGEYDMIKFHTVTQQGDNGVRALLPKLCKTSIEFKFFGNHVTSDFTAVFDCPISLPDTVDVEGNRELIDSVRPISLSEDELAVYKTYDSLHAERPDIVKSDTITVDSTHFRLPSMTIYSPDEEVKKLKEEEEDDNDPLDQLREIGWAISKRLIFSNRTVGKNGYIKVSPPLSPQYISYSNSKGLTWKMRLRSEYRFSPNVRLQFSPNAAWRFRKHEFYYDIPLWLYYNTKHESSFFFTFSKGNNIANVHMLEQLQDKLGTNTPSDLEDREWHYFGDNMLQVSNYTKFSNAVALAVGLTYHYRRGVHHRELRNLGLTDKFQSLAPSITLNVRPWPKAPVFSINYERALKNEKLNIDYERWEGDVSVKHHMKHLQTLNLRFGSGLYSRRTGNHFMDFANFRANNLPEGWDDDWSGEFQLLDSRLYNESNYYIRGNVSYESPLLLGSLVPIVGRYVERERAYISSLSIAHTRLYSELGYGFTCRIFSMGLFCSFLNTKYQSTTAKFTFELFHRW